MVATVHAPNSRNWACKGCKMRRSCCPCMGPKPNKRHCRLTTPTKQHFTQKHEHESKPRQAQVAQASAASLPPRDEAAPWLKKIMGESEYSTKFRLRRLLLFSGLVLGYSFYYLCRNSLNYVLPVMVNDKALGLSITQLATMTSIFPIAYGHMSDSTSWDAGMSKFVSGVLGARTSPRLLLATGLMATAAVNIAFGFSNSLLFFCILWAINGTLQGFGGPSCARMLTTWFASKERGTFWGLWNIAHNFGGFLAPIVAGAAANYMGWRWGMFVPGIMGLVMGFYVLFATSDSPEKEGYKPVEVIKPKPKQTSGAKTDKGDKPSMMDILLNNVLKNIWIWGMAITYFFVYVIRQGVTSWSVFFLMNVKGVPDAATAGFMVSGLEIGGLAGSLLAGRLADSMVNSAKDPVKEGSVGKRVQVVMLYCIGIVACLTGLRFSPAGVFWVQWLLVFLLGFCIYGPQMLIGLCGAELVGPESVGASEGFLGWIAYLGAANAGVPLSLIVKNMGWDAYFNALTGAAVIAFCIMAPMFRLQSHVQREKEKLLETADEGDEPSSPAPAKKLA